MKARNLIDEAYKLALKKGYNQTRWSSDAGYAINGQTISRILKHGDCKLSTFVTLLDTIGCNLVMEEKEKEIK